MTFKFYYINLKNSTDRKKNMELFFKNLSKISNINYERIEAFDGRVENIDNYLINCEFNKLYSSLTNERSQPKNVYLTKGEFGCLYSHIKALNEFVKTDDPYCFICEDDLDPNILGFMTEKKFKIEFNKIISKINKYGIISLSCVGDYNLIKKIVTEIIPKDENKFVSFKKYLFYGTACYMINKEIANKIINSYVVIKDNTLCLQFNGLNTSLVADNFIYMHSNTKFYLPSLFYTKEYNSTIKDNINKMVKVQNIMKSNYSNIITEI